MTSKLPVIAIVGRPNVGKSTLFNRLARRRQAIVLDKPGMTRDRIMREIELAGRKVMIVDTGGFYLEKAEGSVERQMREQAELAVAEADVVVFMLDVDEPNNPDDEVILDRLRRQDKPLVAVVNKCDTASRKQQALDFYRLGLEHIIPISALHDHGTGELIEAIEPHLPPPAEGTPESEDLDSIRVAILGRPNSGKSTLVNAILGEDRVIANPVPGTTRDAIDSFFTREGQRYMIVDTAGIRRRGKVARGAEMLSVFSAIRSLDRCHIGILLLDGQAGVTSQDQHIAGHIEDSKRACIVAVNKWDLISDEPEIHAAWEHEMRHRLKFLQHSPWIGISALKGDRIDALFPLIDSIYKEYRKQIDTSELNKALEQIMAKNPPPNWRGRNVKMKYITQTFYGPPVFTIFVNFPEAVHFSYQRYLRNEFHKRFGFFGCNITFRFKKK